MYKESKPGCARDNTDIQFGLSKHHIHDHGKTHLNMAYHISWMAQWATQNDITQSVTHHTNNIYIRMESTHLSQKKTPTRIAAVVLELICFCDLSLTWLQCAPSLGGATPFSGPCSSMSLWGCPMHLFDKNLSFFHTDLKHPACGMLSERHLISNTSTVILPSLRCVNIAVVYFLSPLPLPLLLGGGGGELQM